MGQILSCVRMIDKDSTAAVGDVKESQPTIIPSTKDAAETEEESSRLASPEPIIAVDDDDDEPLVREIHYLAEPIKPDLPINEGDVEESQPTMIPSNKDVAETEEESSRLASPEPVDDTVDDDDDAPLASEIHPLMEPVKPDPPINGATKLGSRFLKAKKADSTRSYDTSHVITEDIEEEPSPSPIAVSNGESHPLLNGDDVTLSDTIEYSSAEAVNLQSYATMSTGDDLTSRMDDSLLDDSSSELAPPSSSSPTPLSADGLSTPGLNSEPVEDENTTILTEIEEQQSPARLSPPPGLTSADDEATAHDVADQRSDAPPGLPPPASAGSLPDNDCSPSPGSSRSRSLSSPPPGFESDEPSNNTPESRLSSDPPPGLEDRMQTADAQSEAPGNKLTRALLSAPPGLTTTGLAPVSRFALRRDQPRQAACSESDKPSTSLSRSTTMSSGTDSVVPGGRAYSRKEIMAIGSSADIQYARYLLPIGLEGAYSNLPGGASVKASATVPYDSILPRSSPERLLFDLLSRPGSWLSIQRCGSDQLKRETNSQIGRLIHHISLQLVLNKDNKVKRPGESLQFTPGWVRNPRAKRGPPAPSPSS